MTSFTRISPNDAKALINQGKSQIIDIRDAMSFQMGHMTSATRIDNQNLAQFIAQADPQAPLIVCCYHGNSSQGAAQYFNEQGFQDVYSLDGGFEQWKVMYPEDCES
jgi:thiosulfate sulfurtransferase|tara:strand:+ start:26199 stop:26519 length:321 start_codon:yes stop_codon:yes gene_type:complete